MGTLPWLRRPLSRIANAPLRLTPAALGIPQPLPAPTQERIMHYWRGSCGRGSKREQTRRYSGNLLPHIVPQAA
jgi:hypothetical protein